MPRTLNAELRVPQAPWQVHAFLAELENHHRLSDRFMRLDHLDPDMGGGRIIIGSPFGLRRTARTTVLSRGELRISGRADIGRHTSARVHWAIEPHGEGARVHLTATVLRAGPVDRVLLAIGGGWWLRRRFDRVLALLADALEQAWPRPVLVAA